MQRLYLSTHLQNPNPDVALKAALAFLKIEANTYANIPSLELKKEFLLYKFLRTEISLCRNPIDLAKNLEMAELAYHIILTAPISSQVNSSYSRFSFGLSELDLRTTRKSEKKSKTLPLGLEESVMRVGAKKGGVEPGFEAIHAKDVLLHLFKTYLDQTARIRIIQACHADIQQLHAKFKDVLPKYLVKLDYQETKFGRVIAAKEDLKRAKTVQEFYAKGEVIGEVFTWFYQQSKSVTVAEKNCEAVLEAAANDIARLFMPVQDQTLYQGRYEDGTLKLMLKAAWITGARTLAPIAGGTNNDNYCVKPLLFPRGTIKFISDSSITLADKLPIFIIQNDRDAIGSQGQNKLRRGDEFIAIDFGHAYQAHTTLIDKIAADFHIQNPDFKNYSVFYDSKRNNMIRGLIKLAALSGITLSDDVLNSYGVEFASEISAIVPHSDEMIFDDYITKFNEMLQQFQISDAPERIKKENINSCIMIISKLMEAKQKHVEARDKLIEKFKFYLSVNCEAVDLLENLEKLSTPIDKMSLRSPDGTVLLNHIRIEDAQRATWDIQLGSLEKHTITGTFASVKLAEQALIAIQSFLPTDLHATLLTLKPNGKTISLSFDKANLSLISAIFNEDEIQKRFFPEDYKLSRVLKMEEEIVNTLAAFKVYGVQTELKATDQQYTLSVSSPNQGKDPIYRLTFSKLKELFAYDTDNARFIIPFEDAGLLRQKLKELNTKCAFWAQALQAQAPATSVFNAAGAPQPSSDEVQKTLGKKK